MIKHKLVNCVGKFAGFCFYTKFKLIKYTIKAVMAV